MAFAWVVLYVNDAILCYTPSASTHLHLFYGTVCDSLTGGVEREIPPGYGYGFRRSIVVEREGTLWSVGVLVVAVIVLFLRGRFVVAVDRFEARARRVFSNG